MGHHCICLFSVFLQTMAIVAHTLVDLVKNLQSFGGIILVRLFSYHVHTG